MSARPKSITPFDWRTIILHGGMIAVLLVIAIVMWWRVWVTGHPSSTINPGGDVSEALGFLAWAPWAVVHGHNPFLSNAIYAGQGGANMLTNASWIAFALLFAPFTWLFGPIATFNIVVTLAPVVSGWCFFLAVRKFTRFVPGQVAGAVLYGFSPVIVTSDPVGHFFQIWLFYPPLAFLCLYDLFVSQRHRPLVLGIAFGLLTVVQFFTSTEVLAICVVVGLIGAIIAAAMAPRRAWERRRHILVGLTAAATTAGTLLAYPFWFALAGPQHIMGAAWPNTPTGGSPPLAPINPGPFRHVNGLLAFAGYPGPAGPTASYVGIGVVAFLLVSVIAWHRSRLAWLVVGVGLSSWALSLGTVLLPERRATDGIWLPWRLFQHIPVVSQVGPSRFCAITILAVALLLALSADGWWRLVVEHNEGNGRIKTSRRRGRSILWMSGAGVAVVTAATLVPLGVTYSFPYVIHDASIPSWFQRVAPTLPPDTVLLAYPYPGGGSNQAMGWQAVNGIRYRIVGGFAIVPGRDGQHSAAVSPFGGSRAILDALSVKIGNGPLPRATESVIHMLRQSLRKWGVEVLVVTHQGRSPEYAVGVFTAVLGRLPLVQHGAWVWYGVGRDPPLRVVPADLSTCVASYGKARRFFTKADPLYVAKCLVTAAQNESGAVRN